MGELRRISDDDIVIAILSLYLGVSTSEIIRIIEQESRERKQPPGPKKSLSEMKELAEIAIKAGKEW